MSNLSKMKELVAYALIAVSFVFYIGTTVAYGAMSIQTYKDWKTVEAKFKQYEEEYIQLDIQLKHENETLQDLKRKKAYWDGQRTKKLNQTFKMFGIFFVVGIVWFVLLLISTIYMAARIKEHDQITIVHKDGRDGDG